MPTWKRLHGGGAGVWEVFGEQVLAVESLVALRAQAAALPQFPAEDTPLRIPAEVERLRGRGERQIRV